MFFYEVCYGSFCFDCFAIFDTVTSPYFHIPTLHSNFFLHINVQLNCGLFQSIFSKCRCDLILQATNLDIILSSFYDSLYYYVTWVLPIIIVLWSTTANNTKNLRKHYSTIGALMIHQKKKMTGCLTVASNPLTIDQISAYLK